MLPIKIVLPREFYVEEIRNGYTISREMKDNWAIELDLLSELDRVCSAHDIKYFACGGTLLGAIRHGGYIPWDDDIDLVMMRDDYQKLCMCASEFKAPYFFQTEHTDRGSLRGHAQLRNSLTTGILKTEIGNKYTFNQGIFIDIFALDKLPEEELEREHFYNKLKRIKKSLRIYSSMLTYSSNTKPQGIKEYIKCLSAPVFKIVERVIPILNNLYDKYESEMQSYNKYSSKYVGISCIPPNGNKLLWKQEWFDGEIKRVKFEGMNIPVPKGYMELLKRQYGDWSKFVVGTSLHGDVIFNAKMSYVDYLKNIN